MATYEGPDGRVEAARVPRPEEFDQGAEFNAAMEEAARFAGASPPYLPDEPDASRVYVPIRGQRYPAFPGEYIVKNAEGDLDVWQGDEFERLHEAVTEPAEPQDEPERPQEPEPDEEKAD